MGRNYVPTTEEIITALSEMLSIEQTPTGWKVFTMGKSFEGDNLDETIMKAHQYKYNEE